MVDLAAVREEEQVIVRVADNELHDGVFFARGGALCALAAAPLGAELFEGHAFDVVADAERDDAVLVGDEVFFAEVFGVRLNDLSAARVLIAVLLLHLDHVVADQEVDLVRVGEEVFELRDFLLECLEFVQQSLALEGGEAAQLHIEDRARLDFGEGEGVCVGERANRGGAVRGQAVHEHSARALEEFEGVGGRRGGPNGGDNSVQLLNGAEQALEDVFALLRLFELEFGAPLDHFVAVGDEDFERALEADAARRPIDDRHHVHREGGAHGGVLVEQILDLGGRALPLQFDDDAHAGAVALIAQVGDAFDLLIAYEVGDLLDEDGLVHLVGELGDDDAHAAADRLFEAGAGVHGDAAVAFAVSQAHLFGVLANEGDAVRREVWALHDLEEVIERGVGVLDEQGDGVGQLVQVVRRDVRRHAHRDTGRAVEEQVGDARGEDPGLLVAPVVVRFEVHGVLVNVREHLFGDRRHAGFGVAHGGWRVAVNAAEVALPIDQGVAQGELLGHADEGVVDGLVAVRVVLAHDIADGGGRLAIAGAGAGAALVHAPEDAPLDGLEAVARIGEGARNDHAHGVIEVARAHLGFYLDGADVECRFECHRGSEGGETARDSIPIGGLQARQSGGAGRVPRYADGETGVSRGGGEASRAWERNSCFGLPSDDAGRLARSLRFRRFPSASEATRSGRISGRSPSNRSLSVLEPANWLRCLSLGQSGDERCGARQGSCLQSCVAVLRNVYAGGRFSSSRCKSNAVCTKGLDGVRRRA